MSVRMLPAIFPAKEKSASSHHCARFVKHWQTADVWGGSRQ
uniref:Uncharacterized protein n=1 Tax=Anguilla anguilla TaxID=7936 RepID=A0A0E9U533_ANGAN